MVSGVVLEFKHYFWIVGFQLHVLSNLLNISKPQFTLLYMGMLFEPLHKAEIIHEMGLMESLIHSYCSIIMILVL